jgi:type III restriction enzyme
MKDKEKLLSFETPLKFIFSHSALKEGWDNPNVFQICTLRDIQTERERRQTIGRGLRLCVNQNGDRIRGFEVNTLTVIAMESYEEFAENLQKEIEDDTGIPFGIIEEDQFASISSTAPDGSMSPLGSEQSKALWEHFRELGYIDTKGKVQDSLKKALNDNSIMVPESFTVQLEQIMNILKKHAGRIQIKNADERRIVNTRQAMLHSAEFKALWNRIKHRTTYRVNFDNERLIKNCIEALQEAPKVKKTRLQWHKADIAIVKSGVEASEHAQDGASNIPLDEGTIELPDLLTELQDRTQLTRRTIHRIVTESNRLDDFIRNPNQYIELTSEVINRSKRLAVVDGIKYQRLGDEHYYAQELFESKELMGYFKNLLEAKKSIYEHIMYDSETERTFAEHLERNEEIKVYAKLPNWFAIPTPLGSYTPDWAIVIEKDGEERLYFVVETKASRFSDDLREKENAKIKCGKAHFRALSTSNSPAQYIVARKLDDVFP